MQVLLYSTDREGFDNAKLSAFCGKSKAEVIARFGEPDGRMSLYALQDDLNWSTVAEDYWYVFVTE